MNIELQLVEIHRSVGRLEGKIDGMQNIPERVRILEQRQAWLKGAWAFLIGAFAWFQGNLQVKEVYHVRIYDPASARDARDHLLGCLCGGFAMPDPGSNSSSGYLWLFRFMHSVAGNITTVFGGKIPGLKTIVFLLLIPLLFTTACAAHYTVHPGALNKTDSATYDTLLIAETAIDQARIDYNAGGYPAKQSPP